VKNKREKGLNGKNNSIVITVIIVIALMIVGIAMLVGETEVYEGQKFQDIKIVYNLVGAIDLPQYAM
jgi:ribosomal protein S19